jgi:transposase InsO family protein
MNTNSDETARIKRLRTYIHSLETERDEKFVDTITGMVTEDMNDDYVAIKAKIDKAVQTLTELIKIQEVLKETEQKANALSQQQVLKSMQETIQLQKVLQSYMAHAPAKCCFKDNSNAIEFIDSFLEWLEPKLKTVEETKMLLIPLLELCMKDVSRRAAFIQTLENRDDVRADSKQLKEAFLLFFIGNTWKGNQWTQLFSIAMGKEKPSEYVARVTTLCRANGIQMEEGNYMLKKPLITAWFNKLPGIIQNGLKSKVTTIMENGTIQDYLNLIQEEVPQEVGFIEKCSLHCPYCTKFVVWSCECKTGKLNGKRSNDFVDSKETKKAKTELNTPQDSSTSKGNSSSFAKALKDGKCVHCQGVFDKTRGGCVSKCPKSQKKLVTAAITVDTVEERELDLEDLFEQAHVVASVVKVGWENQRPMCMLSINRCNVMGYIDTMSDVSLMTIATCNKVMGTQKAKLQKMPMKLRGANGKALPVLGTCELEIVAPTARIKHRFVVVRQLVSEIQCLVGLDLQSKLGITLVNQYNLQNLQEREVRNSVNLQEPEKVIATTLYQAVDVLEFSNKSDEKYFDALNDYRMQLMDKLASEISVNTQLSGFSTAGTIGFKTKDNKPVYVKQYEIPHFHRAIVNKKVNEWLELGIVEEFDGVSDYNNPLLAVPKRDVMGNVKDQRVCLDPRKINEKIADSTWQLPLVRDIFDKLAGKKLFSLIDLKSGYNQIKVAEEDRNKTTFTWNGKTYRFVGVPFGFKNVPGDFQRIMSNSFKDMPFVMVYVDDIIIASDKYSEHESHVQQVIQRLNELNLRSNWDKCMLARDRLIVLGHEVSEDGIRPCVEKLVKMEQWKAPKTLKMLQRQLGFLNYFRDYIPKYSDLMAPVESLRSQGNNIKWTKDHDDILAKVRSILETRVLLQFPDFDKELFVGTDASKYGIGAVLYQLTSDGSKKYIRFASRSLSKSEQNYGAPQRELLAVLFALRSFHVYLFGHKFKVFTDHKSLTYMLQKTKVSGVIQNWMDEILTYNFTMEHLPGLLNHLPDAMSRFYDDDPRDETEIRYTLVTAMDEDVTPDIYSEDLNDLEIETNDEVKKDLMARAHMRGHLGAADMARLIRSSKRVTWPQMVKDCQHFVSCCIDCQRFNIGKHGFHPPKNLTALLPFDHLVIDLKSMPLSKNGNTCYLLIVDVATRFLFIRPLPDKNRYTVARCLLRVFCDIGFPKILQSDNGGEFVNEILDALKKISNIDGRHIAPYHHRANGLVERSIGSTSNAILKSLQGLVSQWDEYTPTIQYYFNTRVIELHGSSPYSLIFARQPNDWIDYRDVALVEEGDVKRKNRLLFLNSIVFPTVREKVKKKLAERNEYFMKKNRILRDEYPVGSQVMIKDELRSSKVEPRYEGPFTVVRRQASGNYLLKAIDGSEYVRPPNVLKLVAPEIIDNLKLNDTIYAAVDRIITHKEINGETYYQVRWKDCSADMDTWLKHEDFIDYGPITKYEKQLPKLKVITERTTSVKERLKRTPKIVEIEEPREGNSKTVAKELIEPVQVEMNLSEEQSNAVGEYWKTINRTRVSGSRRNQGFFSE